MKGHTKSWEAHECDQQFGENGSIDIGKIQRLRNEGNARINKVSAMKQGLAKIIQKCVFHEILETLKLSIIKQGMLAVLITLTPGLRNKFVDCQIAKVRIAVLPILDVKTSWNSTLELLNRAYRLRVFT